MPLPIGNGIDMWQYAAMRTALDKFGRIVIPKPARIALNLDPGDELEVAVSNGVLELRPVSRPEAFSVRAGLPIYIGPVPEDVGGGSE